MKRCGALLLIAVLAACSSSAKTAKADSGTTTTANVTTTTAATTATVAAPLTFAGTGKMNTDPFTLAGGAYLVTYDFSAACFYGPDIQPTQGGYLFGASLPSGMGPKSGTDNLYNIKAGSYYLQMITGSGGDCPWSLTLTSR